MSHRVVILGCGSSGGVPRVGGDWGACDPANPLNRRRRCSILVERTGPAGVTTALIDTSPDLREQLLATGTTSLDGVRPLVIKMKRRIDLHMDEATSLALQARFGYIFETPPGSQYPPLLTDCRLIPGQSARIGGPGGDIEAVPFRLDHGDMDSLGFRFGAMAYTPDLIGIPEESQQYLENLDLWIIDALRYTRHPSHFSLEEALDWIKRMRPRRAVLTNLHTDLDYDRLKAELPAGVTPAYDGMSLEF
jgi:phosphoribosyl 1,2-cyclic phosphate phosphodiesterase